MTTLRYVMFFGLILLVVAAAISHEYWGPAVLPKGTASVGSIGGEGLSFLNIGITVVLFILLAFSILNIYSFFNAQIDTERKGLRTAQRGLLHEVTSVRTDIGRLEDIQEGDYLYERNLLCLLTDLAPVHARTTSAAFFFAHEPRDTDLELLENLLKSVPAGNRKLAPLREQLQLTVDHWK